MSEHESIRRDAATFAALHKQMQSAVNTFKEHPDSSHAGRAFEQSQRQFYEFDAPMLALVTPGGRARIRAGDPEFVERAICCLEVDPYHFRSGYNKSVLIRCLKQLALNPRQQERLRDVVCHALDGHERCEIRDFWRLASRIQTPEFIERIRERLPSPEVHYKSQARQLLDYLNQFNRSRQGFGGKRSLPQAEAGGTVVVVPISTAPMVP